MSLFLLSKETKTFAISDATYCENSASSPYVTVQQDSPPRLFCIRLRLHSLDVDFVLNSILVLTLCLMTKTLPSDHPAC